jgi:hypothetical protein
VIPSSPPSRPRRLSEEEANGEGGAVVMVLLRSRTRAVCGRSGARGIVAAPGRERRTWTGKGGTGRDANGVTGGGTTRPSTVADAEALVIDEAPSGEALAQVHVKNISSGC